MKRIFVILTLLIGFAFNNVNAQDAKSKSTKTEQKSTDKKLKKDGTPDKRFKENKEAKGPLKKDGTPDKRFKANKK